MSKHPELAELEDPSAKDGSTAPNTAAGTPQPTSAPRIKLVTNGGGFGGGAPTPPAALPAPPATERGEAEP